MTKDELEAFKAILEPVVELRELRVENKRLKDEVMFLRGLVANGQEVRALGKDKSSSSE